MERSMSSQFSFRSTKRRLCRLACMLALPMIAGCAYDGAYYDPPPRYGYGYGSYGYGYGGFGHPCGWYGDCYGWGHRHHRHHGRHHWDDDDEDDDHRHRRGDNDGVKGQRPVDRDRHAEYDPPRARDENPGRGDTRGSERGGRRTSPGQIWLPDTGRDSRR
jgi:hypothetical protein